MQNSFIIMGACIVDNYAYMYGEALEISYWYLSKCSCIECTIYILSHNWSVLTTLHVL